MNKAQVLTPGSHPYDRTHYNMMVMMMMANNYLFIQKTFTKYQLCTWHSSWSRNIAVNKTETLSFENFHSLKHSSLREGEIANKFIQ